MNVLIENALTLSKIRKLLKTNCVYTDEHNISTINISSTYNSSNKGGL